MMKQSSFILIVLGMLFGCVIGYAIRGHSEEKAIPNAAVEASQTEQPPPPSNSREQTLLLQAIDLLDLTTAELEDAHAYIRKLERNTQRYNWLMDYWKEKGFGTSYQMAFGLTPRLSLEPSKDLLDFFGWDSEQIEVMMQVGQTTTDAILDWERGHSTCIEESETNLVYRVAPMPEEIMQTYMQAMANILEPDDMELLHRKLEEKFNGMQQERTLSVTLGLPPPSHFPSEHMDNEQTWMKVTETVSDPSNPMVFLGGVRASYRPYIPGQTIDSRWNHVFNMESPASDLLDGTYMPVP